MKFKDLDFVGKYIVVIVTICFMLIIAVIVNEIISNANTDKTNKVSKLYYMCVTEMSHKSGDIDKCDSLK